MLMTSMTNEHPTPEVKHSFLQRIAQGENDVAQELLNRYGTLVSSLAWRFLNNANEVEDAVQDIFVTLWQKAGRFNPNLASETTYVTMVARRRLIDHYRKAIRRPLQIPLNDFEQTRSDQGTNQVDLSDEVCKAVNAIQTLSSVQQRVLKMTVYQDLSHNDISQKTGLPLGTVKTHLRRGLLKLRERLARG